MTPARSWSLRPLSDWPAAPGPTGISWTRTSLGVRRVDLDADERCAGRDELTNDVASGLAAAAEHHVVPEIFDVSLHPSLLPVMRKVALDEERGDRREAVGHHAEATQDERDGE